MKKKYLTSTNFLKRYFSLFEIKQIVITLPPLLGILKVVVRQLWNSLFWQPKHQRNNDSMNSNKLTW